MYSMSLQNGRIRLILILMIKIVNSIIISLIYESYNTFRLYKIKKYVGN